MNLEPSSGLCPICKEYVPGATDKSNGAFLPMRGGRNHQPECKYAERAFDDASRSVDVAVTRGELLFVRIGDLADVMRATQSLTLAVADWQREMPLSERIVSATNELDRATKEIREYVKGGA